ncbi:MAG TPA: HD domain-containing phosphohydrolase, partial [Gammaproteobacteria bacterium]|nr:HD domain-containing phosphohydrolase [Gammaproteobacteria bacterium]
MAEKAETSAWSGGRGRMGPAAAGRWLSVLGTRILSGLLGRAGEAPGKQRKGRRVDTGPAVPLEEERGRAQALHDHARSVVVRLLETARRGGRPDLEPAACTVRQMVESVSRNPDALLGLTRFKDPDRYISMHSLNVCIFALAFGNHLGLGREGLYELGLGALLHDLGKMRVPPDILDKPGPLTAAESRWMRMHPLYSRELLAASRDLPQAAVAAAYLHHERHDGT